MKPAVVAEAGGRGNPPRGAGDGRIALPKELMSKRHPAWLRYAVAVALTVGALLVRQWFLQTLELRNVFLTFYPAVILASLYGGLGPGLLSTILSAALVDYFFIPPLHQFSIRDPADVLGMGIFLLSCVMINGTVEAMHRAQARARRAEIATGVEAARVQEAGAKALLGAIVETSNDAIVSKDLNGTIRSWNATAERILGYRADEIIGKPISLLLPPERVAEEERILEQIKQGEQVNNYDTVRLAKDGRRIEVSVTVSPLRNSAGEITGASKIIRDITERKQAEAALRESQERLQLQFTLLQSAANGLVITGRDGAIQWVNDAFTRLTGYSAAEAIGQNPRLLKSGRQDAAFFKELWETILDGRVWQGEIVNKRKDGSVYTEEMTITPVKSAGGEITHFVAVKQDVSARKQAEEALRRSNARLNLLAENAVELLRSESPQQTVNALCRKLLEFLDCQVFFNYLVDEAKGKLHLNACWGIPAEEMSKVEWLDFGVAVCGCVARDGCRIVAENIPATPDPRTELVKSFGVQAYACHPLIAQGRVLGTLSFGTRHRARFTEDELSLMKAVADQVAMALERRQAQAELVRMAKELLDSNAELQQFAYVASHDLQEPLRAVAGYISLIEERFRDKLDEKGRQHVAGAIEGAERMHALINDLLELSRVGSRAKAFQATDLNAVLDVALHNLGPRIRECGATVTRDSLPMLEVDGSQITLLFQNLISNALKFHSDRPPEIRITARPQSGHWLFAVADNGIGIESQYFERIFQIFQRLHTRKRYPGTGIGLAICKKIVERHGGRLWVESEPGIGSTFYFTLSNKLLL